MTHHDRVGDYINSHPRESLQFLVITIFFLWQSVMTLFALILYLVIRNLKIKWWVLLSLGVVIAGFAICLEQSSLMFYVNHFVTNGININIYFWKLLFRNNVSEAFSFLVRQDINYFFGMPIFVVGLLTTIELIPSVAHRATMQALQNGIETTTLELDDYKMNRAFKTINDKNYSGTFLGISKYTAQPIVIPDRNVNQVALVLGTTGAGKTITLRRFYERAMRQGYPLIVIDGKPDENNINWLMNLAEKYQRHFIGFNCGSCFSYDPLAHGGHTELKDKIICLKDEWSSDHYKSIAEDYLQTTFAVLLKSKTQFDLNSVVQYLNYSELSLLARNTKDEALIKKVMSLEHYNCSDITGLQAHLNILIHSELGQFFEKNDTTFNLVNAISNSNFIYFALPALRFPSFSKVLGKLVINDLKTVIDRNNNQQKIFTVFDEFSVFAGEQILNLVNMGRGKGVHAVFGTQGLADLNKVDADFKNQVLNCVNTLICHRLNDQESAETVANWIGTQDQFNVTAQINTKQGDAAMGTVRKNREFIVHPDMIKQRLQVGEAFYVTKVGGFRKDKVKVKFN